MSGQWLMILAVTCFAVTHASVKFLQGIPFYEIVFFRALISFSICVFAIRKLKISFLGHNKKILLLRGLFGTVALVCYFYTLQELPLATAVTIQYLSPLLTILLSQILLKESAHPIQWLFFVMAFVGVFLTQEFEAGTRWLPVLVGLVAAFGSAFAYNCIRVLKETEHEMVIILYFPMVTLPLMTPVVVYDWVTPQGWEWLVLLNVGVFTQLAQQFMTKSLQKEPAHKVSLYNYLGVVYAIAIGWLLFAEMPTMRALSGMGLIFLSLALSTLIRLKRTSKISA